MKIKRTLKYGSFGWDDETKKFTVEHKGQSIELNKIYAFAFLRFAFSVAQRNWFRKQEKPIKSNETKEEASVDYSPQEYELNWRKQSDGEQLNFLKAKKENPLIEKK
jgi:hypothetical protein